MLGTSQETGAEGKMDPRWTPVLPLTGTRGQSPSQEQHDSGSQMCFQEVNLH